MANKKNITQGQLLEFAKLADERLDSLEGSRAKSQDLILNADGWTEDTENANFPFKYTLTVNGVTTASRADAVLDAGSVAIATDCGVCAVSETAADAVIFRSRRAPTANLTGLLYITKVAAVSGTKEEGA